MSTAEVEKVLFSLEACVEGADRRPGFAEDGGQIQRAGALGQ